MTKLVTVAQAKTHLRVDHQDSDADIHLKLDQASAIVMDYIRPPEEEWDEATAPPLIQAAVLLVLGELYDGSRAMGDPLTPGVKNLLRRYRDPALA